MSTETMNSCPRHFCTGNNCDSLCKIANKFDRKFPSQLNNELKDLYKKMPSHSSLRRESMTFITKTLESINENELNNAYPTIMEEMQKKIKNKVTVNNVELPTKKRQVDQVNNAEQNQVKKSKVAEENDIIELELLMSEINQFSIENGKVRLLFTREQLKSLKRKVGNL